MKGNADAPRRLALVTGTSSGIGEAVARELLGRGWRVVGLSRRPGILDHPSYQHLNVDLSELSTLPERVEQAVGSAVTDPVIERVALVNNAADPGLLGPVEVIDPVAMLPVFGVNVVAPTWLSGWVARRCRRGVPLRIVNVLSGAGVRPFPGLATYGATKAALRMVGMVLASEVDAGRDGSQRDVTILCYSPGPVDTPMQEKARTSSAKVFPLVETFTRWAAEGQLVPPAAPAGEIAAYVEGDGYPGFAECRSGELGTLGGARP